MTDRLLTVRQLADRLGISYRHALELVETRAIRALDFRRPGAKRAARRIDPADVDAFLRERETREKDGAERAERWDESIRVTKVRFTR